MMQEALAEHQVTHHTNALVQPPADFHLENKSPDQMNIQYADLKMMQEAHAEHQITNVANPLVQPHAYFAVEEQAPDFYYTNLVTPS